MFHRDWGWLYDLYRDSLTRKIAELSVIDSPDIALDMLFEEMLPKKIEIDRSQAYLEKFEEAPLPPPHPMSRSQPAMARPIQATFTVQFEGSFLLLEMIPPGIGIGPLLGQTKLIESESRIALELEIPPPTTAQAAENICDEWIEQVNVAVSRVNEELDRMVALLHSEVRPQIEARYDAVKHLQIIKQELTIPIGRSRQQLPILVQRKALRMVDKIPAKAGAGAIANYSIDAEVYEDILRTIEAMSRSMERTPTLAQLWEPDIRNVILFVLNANYEGRAAGEVFNGKGKTDILLNISNANVFIGECKFWTGEKDFNTAIDQLLGYLVWRDSKAALILFIRQADPAAIIQKAQSVIRAHDCFDAVVKEVVEGTSRYVVHSRKYENRLIELALIPVVVNAPLQEEVTSEA